MWNFKSVSLFVASLIVVILVSMKMANAEENKTITPKEFVSNVAEVPSKVGNWLTGEVEKTKAYQTKVWSEAKNKWPWTMFKSKNNASQN
tara:strand:+ start:77 stop:346 length:270 start_codon:yes stop_codon:yes gene_type:complete